MSPDNGQSTPEHEPGAEPPPAPQFNPQSAYPAGDPAAPPPYPASGPTQNPYGAQPYQPAPGQPGMPQFPVYVLPDHPKATSAMVVGLVAVVGMFLCGLPVLASPVAWVLGAQARREIRQAPQQWGGEGKATAGMVLGIVGTVLLALAILLVVLLVVVAVGDSDSFASGTGV